MNLLEGFLLNAIFMIAPLLFYLFYLVETNNLGKKENDLFFDISLCSSIYFCLRFGMEYFPVATLFMITIPLFIAYQRNRVFCAILLSVIIGVTQFTFFKASNLLFISVFFLYYVIYYFCKEKKRIREKEMMNLFLVINVIATSFLFLFHHYFDMKSISFYFQIVTMVLFIYFVPYFLIQLFEKGKEIVNFHIALKELQHQKQIQDSLFKITHEIKNPIAVCKGYLDMFDMNNQEHSQKYIPILRHEIERTLVLLQDFLATTHVKIEKEEMDINMLLEEVTDNFNPILKEKKIQLNLELDDDEYYILGDYNRLNQVFINVIKNGIEAMQEGGSLHLYTKKKEKLFTVYIEDTGEGISKENLEKITEPFFTTKAIGTGLGVGLSMEIIHKHHGKMKYHSKVGKGTKVEISFPLLES